MWNSNKTPADVSMLLICLGHFWLVYSKSTAVPCPTTAAFTSFLQGKKEKRKGKFCLWSSYCTTLPYSWESEWMHLCIFSHWIHLETDILCKKKLGGQKSSSWTVKAKNEVVLYQVTIPWLFYYKMWPNKPYLISKTAYFDTIMTDLCLFPREKLFTL